MKHLFLLIISFLLLQSACVRNKPIDNIFHWPSSGIAEADSLILKYDRDMNELGASFNRDSLEDRMQDIARKYPDNRLIRFRAAYLKARSIPLSDEAGRRNALESAKLLIDSAKYPYDWHRLNQELSDMQFDLSKRFFMLAENINYFRKHKMNYEEGSNLISMGNIMYFLGDTVRALDYYRLAEERLKDPGIIRAVLVTKQNIALCSPMGVREEMYSVLRRDSNIKKDDNLRERVLQNSFIYQDSVAFIDEAIDIAERQNYIDQLPILLTMKGRYLTMHGHPKEGLEYGLKGLAIAGTNSYAQRYLPDIYYQIASAYHYLGEHEMSSDMLANSIWARDSLEIVMNGPGITHLDTLSKIKVAEQNEQIKRYRLALWLSISIAVLLALLGIVLIYIKKRNAERKYRDRLAEEERKQTRQALMAQTMVLEENERLISDITGQLDVLKNSKEIDAESAEAVIRMLRIYKSNEEDRQGFLKVHNELDADFISRLKEAYPTLSESQLKLASLLAVGLDSRRIGNILNIEPASVYRGRSRLRIRLGLSQDQSLEDFLRRFNRGSSSN